MNEHSRLALKTLTYTRHHGQKSQQQKHVGPILAVTTLEWHQILGRDWKCKVDFLKSYFYIGAVN